MADIDITSLQRSLEAEFCPPLDPALVAAMAADYCSPSIVPIDTDAAIRALRQQLTQLAPSAFSSESAAGQRIEDVRNPEAEQEIDDADVSMEQDSLFDAHSHCESSNGGSSSGSYFPSSTLEKLQLSLQDSAFEFLQAAFPHCSETELRACLAVEANNETRVDAVNGDNDEITINMAQIVEELLTQDYIRELEERGFDGSSGAEDTELALAQDLEAWTMTALDGETHGIGKLYPDIEPSRSFAGPSTAAPKGKKKKGKGKTIVLNDIRQHHHHSRARPVNDMWSRLSSISSLLESLIPGRPSTFFLSYFHNPTYPTPYDALCAALSDIPRLDAKARLATQDETVAVNPGPGNLSMHRPCSPYSNLAHTSAQDGRENDYIVSIPTVVEFLQADGSLPANFDQGTDTDVNARLAHHAELAVLAAKGQLDAALDIMKLLLELEADKDRSQEMGVYHERGLLQGSRAVSEPPTSPAYPSASPSSPRRGFSTTSIDTINCATSASSVISSPASNAWQEVTRRNPPEPSLSPHAAFIPAYNPDSRRKSHIDVGIIKVGTSRDPIGHEHEASENNKDYRSLIIKSRANRAEALRRASACFNRPAGVGGGKSSRLGGKHKRAGNGEIAMFYAAQAREHAEEALKLQLDAARQRVENKRYAPGGDPNTIDLHYCTSAEARALVQEVLDEGWVGTNGLGTSRAGGRVLRIITGRGLHSANGVAVLAPVLRNWLARTGWHVSSWDGGLLVHGRSG